MAGTAVRNPSEGRGIFTREGGRNAQVKLCKGTVQERTSRVFLLPEAPRTDVSGLEGPKPAIGVNEKDNIALPRQPGGKVTPPCISGGKVNTRVRGMCDNHSEAQQGGSNPHDE